MGRPTDAGKTPLLEDADQNIGNSAVVQPQAGTTGTIIPQDLRNRIINLSNGGSAAGQTTSIVVTARRIVGRTSDNPNPGYAGPITGVVEFGNGGRSTRAEFDVPIGPFTGGFSAASQAIEPQDGGVIVTVPTGVLRVFARYDNLLLAPLLLGVPPVCLAQVNGVPVVGPGGPIGQIPAEPLLVQAMASYFSRPTSKVYKTTVLYVSPIVPVAVQAQGLYCLPAFARSVKILRFPLSSALDIGLWDNVYQQESFALAGGAPSPFFDVSGRENIISIVSHTPGDTVTYLAFVCEIGI